MRGAVFGGTVDYVLQARAVPRHGRRGARRIGMRQSRGVRLYRRRVRRLGRVRSAIGVALLVVTASHGGGVVGLSCSARLFIALGVGPPAPRATASDLSAVARKLPRLRARARRAGAVRASRTARSPRRSTSRSASSSRTRSASRRSCCSSRARSSCRRRSRTRREPRRCRRPAAPRPSSAAPSTTSPASSPAGRSSSTT